MKPRPSPQRKGRPQAKPAPIARVMHFNGSTILPVPEGYKGQPISPWKTVAVIPLTPENWERMVKIVRCSLRVDNWGASKEDIDCQAVEMFTALGLTAPSRANPSRAGRGFHSGNAP